jgi:outer membrane scaffolding protein for murein synthesis (MipA/OmpV family)
MRLWLSLSLLLLLCLPAAQAELKPEWELGAGPAYIDFPLYRGAAERRSYVLPAPYVQYRGRFLQVDRDRIRSLLLRSERAEVDISIMGAVPVSSKDSEVRQGMPDLDPTVEFGPSLDIRLYHDRQRHDRLDLRLPLRAVFAVSAQHITRQGWLAQPTLNLDQRSLLPGWNLGLQGSLFFGDRDYHSYFYDVAPPYATATRAAYRASGGYGGRQLLASLSRRYGDLWLGGFVKWDDLSGAVFAESPLVQRGQSFAAGVMVAWVFVRSDRMVEVSDD